MGQIKHSFTNAVPDGTATSVVRPSDWNSAHAYTLQDGVSLGGNTAGALADITSGTLILAGGNNITLSQDGNSVTVSAQNALTSQSNQAFSAQGGSSAFQTLNFSNANGFTFSNNAGQVQGSYTVPVLTNSSMTVSDAATSGTIARLAFTNLNGVTLSLSTGAGGSHTIVGSHNALTSQSNQNVTAANGGFAFQTLSFSNINGFSFGTSAGSAITGSYTVPTVTDSSWTVSDAGTSGTVARLAFANLNGITLSLSTGAAGSHTIVGSHNALTSQSNQNVTAANGGFAFQTLSFSNLNGISFGTSAGSAITASHNALTSQSNQQMTLFATGNTTQSSTGTTNVSSLIFRGSGAASVGITNGSILIDVAAGAAAITQSLGMSTQTAGGATGGTTGYATGDDILYHFVPGSNITMSQSINGASGTLSIYGPAAGGGGITLSSYENIPGMLGSATLTFNAASISYAVAFLLPQPLSASFIRLPVLMTTNSTTIATLASATASASGQILSTWNAVIYSLGVGASSRSLQSVASGSAGFTFSQQISITNSTQYSVSQGFSAQAQGAGTTRTTQYSISNTNYSLSTNQIATEWSSVRMIDILFATSLSAGNYWGVFGLSTSSNSAGAGGLAALTNCNVRYSNHYAVSQANLSFGVMGSTDRTSGGLMGAGSFSTAGGGTTNSIPISAISSGSNLVRMYFQMLRSA